MNSLLAAAVGLLLAAAPASPGAKAAKAPTGLKAHATFKGVGPFRLMRVDNQNTFDWTGCTLILPDNRIYRLAKLRAGDHESISNANFTQRGREKDVPLTSVTIECVQGDLKVSFSDD